jgi:hypothetical protein
MKYTDLPSAKFDYILKGITLLCDTKQTGRNNRECNRSKMSYYGYSSSYISGVLHNLND